MKRDLNWLKAKADIRIGCFDMVSMGYAIEMYNEDQVHIEKLEKEIASLKEQLKCEQDAVDYYSLGDVEGDIYLLPGDDIYYEQFRIGKLARTTQARREK